MIQYQTEKESLETMMGKGERAFFNFRTIFSTLSNAEFTIQAICNLLSADAFNLVTFKGGYLDFSHLIELKNIYIYH